jgi:hypothetical protein
VTVLDVHAGERDAFARGFELGIPRGAVIGRRDLEERVSEARSTGFRAGREWANAGQPPAHRFELISLGVCLGLILAGVLAKRGRERNDQDEQIQPPIGTRLGQFEPAGDTSPGEAHSDGDV